MTNLWKQKDIPHKGWTLVDVIDVREDNQPEDETEYESCMMCGNERIRYVHIVEHPQFSDILRVGCVCAENMTSDYLTPRKLEQRLRNRAARRTTWKKKEWKFSIKGNRYLKMDRHLITIFRDKKTNKYKVCIDRTFGKKEFKTLDEAKIAAFNGIEYFKDHQNW
jgi:hypothetical protein